MLGSLASGCRLALKPEFGSATPGVGLGSGVVPGTCPGATRHAAVPVKPYEPWILDVSAAALVAQVDATVAATVNAIVDVIANATDLTNPKAWKSGTSEGEIFRSIRDGAGEAMPPFAEKVPKEEDLWHLVNYTRNLWPDSARPKLEKSTTH